jgi:hypothetical protein
MFMSKRSDYVMNCGPARGVVEFREEFNLEASAGDMVSGVLRRVFSDGGPDWVPERIGQRVVGMTRRCLEDHFQEGGNEAS